jgi:hypothetical protein
MALADTQGSQAHQDGVGVHWVVSLASEAQHAAFTVGPIRMEGGRAVLAAHQAALNQPQACSRVGGWRGQRAAGCGDAVLSLGKALKAGWWLPLPLLLRLQFGATRRITRCRRRRRCVRSRAAGAGAICCRSWGY